MNTNKNQNSKSLYIHIPFCLKICPYCDFVKFLYHNGFVDGYVKQLSVDLDKLIDENRKFETIYIGGGTPSVLSEEQYEILLPKIAKLKAENCEFTIEVNPESLTEEKLQIYKKYDINRISIGIQSFNKYILKSINRDYGIDYFELINLVKKYIDNINVDLIFGFENESKDDLIFDLENFVKLDVDHISIYSLTIYDNTVFKVKNVKPQNEEESREFYQTIVKFLREHGYERYEVSNFARNKKYSRHNLTYWRNERYVGLGVGASGYEENIRYTNSGDLSSYLDSMRKRSEEVVSINDEMDYQLITNLRLEEGVSLSSFKDRFGVELLEKYPKINGMINSKLLQIKGDFLSCTDDGMNILDYILSKIL